MLTSLASWSRNQGEAQPDNSPRHFQKHVQLLVQLNISAGCGHACWVSEVKFVVSLKTMTIQCFFLYRSWQCLLEKKCPALKICRYPTVQIHLATAANEAFVCDCYRNMGHFLCSVERIKSFVNVHLHCIVSNVPLRDTNTQDHQNCCAVKSHSRAHGTFQSNGKARKQETIWMKCVFCSYFYKIIYL